MPNFLIEVDVKSTKSEHPVILSAPLPLITIPVAEIGEIKRKQQKIIDEFNQFIKKINGQAFLYERSFLLEGFSQQLTKIDNTAITEWLEKSDLHKRLKLDAFFRIRKIKELEEYLPAEVKEVFGALLRTVKKINRNSSMGEKLAQVNAIEKMLNLMYPSVQEGVEREHAAALDIINNHLKVIKELSIDSLFDDIEPIKQYKKQLEENKKYLPRIAEFFDNMPLSVAKTLRLGLTEFKEDDLPPGIEISFLGGRMNPVFLIKWKNPQDEIVEIAIIRVYPFNQPDDYYKYVRRNETMLQFATEAERSKILNMVMSEYVVAEQLGMELVEWLPHCLMDKIIEHYKAKHYENAEGLEIVLKDMLPYIKQLITLLISSEKQGLVSIDTKPENLRIKGKTLVFSDQKVIFPQIMFDKTSIELTAEYMDPIIMVSRDAKRKHRNEISQRNLKLSAKKKILLPPEDEDKGFNWEDYQRLKVKQFLLGNIIYQCVTSELATDHGINAYVKQELYRYETHEISDPEDPTKMITIQQHEVFKGEPGSVGENLKKLVAALTHPNPANRISLEKTLDAVKRLEYQLTKPKNFEKEYTRKAEEIKIRSIGEALEHNVAVPTLYCGGLKKRNSASEILPPQQNGLETTTPAYSGMKDPKKRRSLTPALSTKMRLIK